MVSAEDWLYLNSQDCGTTSMSPRIVNGNNASEGQFPWMAFLLVHYKSFEYDRGCGAAFVTRQHIMTAAHCMVRKEEKPVYMTVFYGSRQLFHGAHVNVIQYLTHPDYVPTIYFNDIAILMLEHPVTFSSTVRPICIPRGPLNATGLETSVAGWGALSTNGTRPEVLRYTTIKIIPDALCREKFRNSLFDKETMYCAYEVDTDTCEGDSGGPMMARRKRDGHVLLVGIVSYGKKKCAMRDTPAVYTRVDAFVPWILDNIGEYSRYKPLKVREIEVAERVGVVCKHGRSAER